MGRVINRIPVYFESYMEKTGVTQRELASRIGVSESLMSRIMKGERSLSVKMKTLEKICNLMKVTPNDLLWEEDAE
jgi:DNA-binding Xre family transcriptional regulator